ncbi:hypothetical protein NUU61_007880 [Penicillium alfredii]|uniref:Uncharacterized protein n=1 Tax=Penicillium alfredii TaxID=1506179 RepID=A0A9W9ERB3_9EURO|nr:uncharacterized protein NUU61_007880 [Penicillium alfredii]KAJ5086573.1 hypothetical protein NUU61_007880 [Penicillium alfredii]
MTVNYDRGACGAVDRPCLPESASLAAQGIRHDGHIQDSASLSPSYDNHGTSESILSDDRSIFNAIRVSSSREDIRFGGSAYNNNPVLEQGLAANMAMFIPTGHSHGGSSFADFPYDRIQAQGSRTLWWRSQMRSDQCLQSSHPPGPTSFNDDPALDSARPIHCKAVSLGDRGLPEPKWPGPLPSAVKSIQPRYPPPARAPTPPGFRLSNGVSTPWTSRHTPGEGSRIGSYGDAVRKFFGLSASSTSRPAELSVAGIGRAEDGTAVQGRFPYRTSGHGMNLARQLDDHPFHQRNLAVAQCEMVAADSEPETDASSSKNARAHLATRTPQAASSGRPCLSSGAALPSAPAPAVTGVSRKLIKATALFSPPRNPARQSGPSRVAPSVSPAESPVEGNNIGRGYLPPNPSQLQLPPLTATVDGTAAEEDFGTETFSSRDLMSWLTARIYLCCCLGNYSTHKSHGNFEEPLNITSSLETYATARSEFSAIGPLFPTRLGSENQHPRWYGFQCLVSSVSGLVSPARRIVDPVPV